MKEMKVYEVNLLGKSRFSNENTWMYGTALQKDRNNEESGRKQEWQKVR